MNRLVFRMTAVHVLFALLCSLTCLISAAQPQPNASTRIRPPQPDAPAIAARSHILQDFHSGQILSANNADMRVDPASITKIMTSYVVFQELRGGNLQLHDEVAVSEKAWRMEGSRMFIEVGTRVSVEDLIRGMVVQSGNDASVALAEHIAGSEDAFASLMNQYAQRLEMHDTHYTNATGLPGPEHYTTAADVAKLSRAIIAEFPDEYAYYSEREFTFNDVRQSNRNRLLFQDDSVDGIKTGHTEAAGYCLAASSEIDGMRLISVVMGADSEAARAEQSLALLSYGQRFYETVHLYAVGEQLGEAQLWKGAQNTVPVAVPNDVYITIPRGRYDDLAAVLNLQTPLLAPVTAGQVIAEVVVYLDNEALTTQSLQAAETVEAAGFLKNWWHGMRLWLQDDTSEDSE